MVLKKITIMFLPDGGRTVRQFKIPKALVHFFMLFSLSALVFLGWTFIEYCKFPERVKLIQENKQRAAQLAALTDKIDQINTKLVELKKFDNKLKVMVDLEPGDDDTQFLGMGGPDLTLIDSSNTIEDAHKRLTRLMHQSLDNLEDEIAVQTQEKAQLYEFLEGQKSMLACTPSIWPAQGWATSGFGNRVSPFTNQREFHEGLDISARIGTEIIAPADGIISGIDKTYGFGNLIIISHGYGVKTIYGHLSKALVKKGQSVKRGDKIALIGNTGRTTGPHLHYEIQLNGVPVNPQNYILN
ncbi:MAG TPA: M23 family metallopeptidase [Desulfatiglandales bacterium]|nr:M23 family metallopeptidase [Desulfatiglandales bacterium]